MGARAARAEDFVESCAQRTALSSACCELASAPACGTATVTALQTLELLCVPRSQWTGELAPAPPRPAAQAL